MKKESMTSEKDLERTFGEIITKKGGWSVKLLSTFVKGLPDRLVMFDGKVCFVEFKSTGKKPTKIQLLIHGKLKRLGFDVYVVDCKEQRDNIINILTK